ncbi:MAG: hypothetical protein E7117_00535 [Bacteroidales bacterium]|nr:hypothetical protein [Bacteroidales bacterium]
MYKKTLIASVFIVCLYFPCDKLQAQIGIHVFGSLGGTNDNTLFKEPLADEIHSNIFYFGIGADYDIPISSSKFFVCPSIIYAWGGYKQNYEYGMGGYDFREHMFIVPIHLKRRFYVNRLYSWYLFAGPAICIGLSSKSKYELFLPNTYISGYYDFYSGNIDFDEIASLYHDINGVEAIMIRESTKIGLKYNRLELRVDFGVGFVFGKHLELTIGLSFDIFDRYKGNIRDKYSFRPRYQNVGLAYRFPLRSATGD